VWVFIQVVARRSIYKHQTVPFFTGRMIIRTAPKDYGKHSYGYDYPTPSIVLTEIAICGRGTIY
jgi:hypothetical protein